MAVLTGAAFLSYLTIDRPGAEWGLVRCNLQPWVTVREILAPLGSGAVQAGVLLLLAGASSLVRRWRPGRRAAGWLLLTLLIASLVATGVKMAVRRPRPPRMHEPLPSLTVQLNHSGWHSFPSGDVLATTALVGVTWGLLGRSRRWAWLLVIPALVGVQRFVAARHFVSDILGGAALGLLVAELVLMLARWPLPAAQAAGPQQEADAG